MNKLLAKKLHYLIKKYQTIIIAKHVFPDWDAQGSALGLANLIQDNYKGKTIYVVGERIDDDSSFPSDQLTLEALGKALLIVVDTANAERIDFENFAGCQEIFKIDHHLVVDDYGNYNLVDDTAIACTQIITLWAEKMKLKISPLAAKNLYKGLVTDSGRFLFSGVNSQTFQAASILMENGVDLHQVQNELYLQDLKVKQWQNYAFNKLVLTPKGVGYIVVGPSDYQPFNLEYDQVKNALYTMSGIKEIKIWFTVIEVDQEFKVSLRSRDYEVNQVARKFNGGGHKLASGAKVKNLAELPQLIKALEALIV